VAALQKGKEEAADVLQSPSDTSPKQGESFSTLHNNPHVSSLMRTVHQCYYDNTAAFFAHAAERADGGNGKGWMTLIGVLCGVGGLMVVSLAMAFVLRRQHRKQTEAEIAACSVCDFQTQEDERPDPRLRQSTYGNRVQINV
jgi:hypothetical protein